MSTQNKENIFVPVPQKKDTVSSEQKFQNLDQQSYLSAAPNDQKRISQSKSQNKTNKPKLQQARLSSSKQNMRPKSINMQDQLKQSVSLCQKCLKCLQLQQKLHRTLADKQIVEYNLIQITIQHQQLKRKYKGLKQDKVDKSQLDYCVQSLKQMIKSYEDQDQRLQKFIYQTMNITPKSSATTKSGAQVAQGIVTQFISNWQEINRELDILVLISSPNLTVTAKKQNKIQYDYYQTMAKLEEIKENVANLQKIVRKN